VDDNGRQQKKRQKEGGGRRQRVELNNTIVDYNNTISRVTDAVVVPWDSAEKIIIRYHRGLHTC
jgi:hypothetical protein